MRIFQDKRGFTLLELIIVVIILGIMASLAIPKVNGIIEKSRAREAVNMLGVIYSSEQRYAQENGVTTDNLSVLDIAPIPALVNFLNPNGFMGGVPPTGVFYERVGSTYRVHIDFTGATSGQIRCSDGVNNFGAGPCSTIGFQGAVGTAQIPAGGLFQ